VFINDGARLLCTAKALVRSLFNARVKELSRWTQRHGTGGEERISMHIGWGLCDRVCQVLVCRGRYGVCGGGCMCGTPSPAADGRRVPARTPPPPASRQNGLFSLHTTVFVFLYFCFCN
jgi:hypothetical protein